MRFEWDPRKDEANRKKHGISFEVAQLVFADPLALSIPDQDREFIRLISARKATPKERKQYMNLPGGQR